jgi:outer membrane protein TolC
MAGLLHGQQGILEAYVNEGLENNLMLKQKSITFKQSLEALNEARGMFLPSLNVEARYSRAGGGRMIDIPIGDLMNPVNSTLNELLASVGQPPSFPTDLPNENIPFLREEEHETKLRLVQPIFNPAIYYNVKIRSQQSHLSELDLSLFKKALTADIKTAYLNYLKTVKVADLYDKTRELLEENLRVNKRLVDSGKATEDAVFRADAELSELTQQQAEALKNKKLAAAWFNFLLNRSLDSPIDIMNIQAFDQTLDKDIENYRQMALENREEIKQLSAALTISEHNLNLSKSSYVPQITGVVDYGYQGEKYRFTEKDDYWMASLVLNWNLFNGFQDKSRYDQAVLSMNRLDLQKLELNKKISLQVQEAYENIKVAGKSLEAARDRLQSTKKTFRLVRKKYEQGMTPQIDYLDARTRMTNAEIGVIIAEYDLLIKSVEFDKSIGM